ncbi:hypothetical protein BSKO_01534 [Bryopsis sp. KO-2023]|nr:hypothetical protein BSKO_01534 [Bryopsis sp. KO-2023]
MRLSAGLHSTNAARGVCRASIRSRPIGTRTSVSSCVTSRDRICTGLRPLVSSVAVAKSSKRRDLHVVRSEASPVTKEPEEGGIGKTLVLGLLFAGWYGANIYFNIYNKQVLKVYPYPVTCTCIQFGVGSVLALLGMLCRVVKPPKFSSKVIFTILPLAMVHTMGNLFTNVSLGKVAVSFTHTIKAMEPFFSVLLSSIFLGDKPSLLIILSLFPIVGGVAAASLSEATFNWGGFAAAMGSNITFQSRNVLSKKTMNTSEIKMDNITLFSLITMMSFVLLLPFALLTEGFTFSVEGMKALGVLDPSSIIMKAVAAGALFHTYQQVSYMILQRVSPVTHSIGNCVKRVIVIIASVVVFQNAMSTQNQIGTGVALFGVFCYSQAKRLQKKNSA